MKLNGLLAMFFAMTLSACATESITGQDSQTSHHEQYGIEKSNCSDPNRQPGLACSDTATATFDQQGKLWLVWVYQGRIYLQSSEDKGGHFSEPIMVNSEAEPIAAHGEYRPKIQVDAKGNLYFTWTQNLEKRHTGHIRFSSSTDGGKTFSKPVTVNDNLNIIGHRFDALAVGKNGEIFIAWLDARDKERAKAANQEFSGSSVYYTWSDNGGKSFYPNQVAAPHSCECCRLGVAIDRDNLPLILWRHVFDGNIRDHALLKFGDWRTPGAMRRVSRENWQIDACPHHGPSLAIADNGDYHAAWFSAAPGNQGLFYANSSDGGISFSSPYAFGGQGAGHPSVMALGMDTAIVWTQFDGENNRLLLMRSEDRGKTWAAPREISATRKSADDAFLLSDGKKLYVSWQTGEGYQFIDVEGR